MTEYYCLVPNQSEELFIPAFEVENSWGNRKARFHLIGSFNELNCSITMSVSIAQGVSTPSRRRSEQSSNINTIIQLKQ